MFDASMVPDYPWINKKHIETQVFFHKESIYIHCFVMNEYLEHEFSHGTHLAAMKSSITAFDCLNITSVALLGCSFMARQGPYFMDRMPYTPHCDLIEK